MEQRTIERVSIAMAGGPDAWAGIGEPIRQQYRELARRAVDVLGLGNPVPWEHVEISVMVELAECRGMLHPRRPGDEATKRVAGRIAARLKQSGFTVIHGPPAKDMTTPVPP